MKDNKIIKDILGWGIIVIVILIIVSVIAIFAGAIMQFFGFRYNSVWDIILFFLISTIISLPINFIAEGLPKALLKLKKLNLYSARIIFVLLDTIATAIGMTIVDHYMPNVSATDSSILVIAFILAILSIKDIKENKE
mgnify:FL=1